MAWATESNYCAAAKYNAVRNAIKFGIYGVRADITVRVLNEAFLGSNLQLGVLCYARVDFAGARHASFVFLEGISH